MIRCLLLFGISCLFVRSSYGQLTVFQNKDGYVFTTVDEYGPGTITATSYKKLTYADSPFLAYPIWQPGRVKLDAQGKYMACDIAYNLVENAVLCRFSGDSTVQTLRPDRFIIGNEEFVRQRNRTAGTDYKLYAKVLYDGKTKLLLNVTKRLDPYASASARTGYEKETTINGRYTLEEKYFIRKGDARPEAINLTKNSLLAVLYEQADKLAPRLPARRLTSADVVAILPYYDSLMTVSASRAMRSGGDSVAYVSSSVPISNDPVFAQALHQHIVYPGAAWIQAVYSRVYAGFDVDQQGRVRNVTILSPDNAGMGFAEAVRAGLEKIPTLNPTFAGTYALPVAFTYTNQKESRQPHIPVNRLPDDRLAGRTLLGEFVVPVVVTKPILTSREVWGYFK
ncbi:hypothetical protein CLV58_10722 [Spirosoma oryzae]|uniref:TonB C-terminal domain-containing protein n=1 Tax=Spirosoma oryzae TaxID=1469603 RepID=A0A2T0T2S2_9BACT|nr:hypothetical protein [Spirosoma oryzae]PRY39929.1 hypothetical protein CLV58_10722 [Spirosoma oryzae]